MNFLMQHKSEEVADKLLPFSRTAWLCRYKRAAFDSMKNPSRRDSPRATARRSHGDCPDVTGSVGRWAFSLATESLFPLGSTESARRAAYRSADGQIRFLPL